MTAGAPSPPISGAPVLVPDEGARIRLGEEVHHETSIYWVEQSADGISDIRRLAKQSRRGRVGSPADVVEAPPRAGRRAVREGSRLFHIFQTSAGGGWSSWEGLGGNLTSAPTVLVNADGRLETFARGTDNALWRTAQATPGGGWSRWMSLGPQEESRSNDPLRPRLPFSCSPCETPYFKVE